MPHSYLPSQLRSSSRKETLDNPDKALLIGATSANAYDFYTTKKYILNNGGRIKEPWSTLLYLGDERPSTSFFALSKVAQLGLAWIVIDRMESKWRKAILFLMTGTWVYYGVSNSH